MQDVDAQNVQILPGALRVNSLPVQMATVVSYGIASAIYDAKLQFGGLCHYLYPDLPLNTPPTAKYAKPSLSVMFKLFLDSGSHPSDLEVSLYGAGEGPEATSDVHEIARANLAAAVQFFTSCKLKIHNMDVGGYRGRKIVFNPQNGEIVVAKVGNLRLSDWQV